MPWQQYVADVLGEIDESGRLAYSEFGLTVPRQSGKSTWVLAKAVHRCSATKFFGSRQRLVYTAQTRLKAREKWEEDYATALEGAREFRGRYDVHKGNGNEHFRFTNGSRFGIDANTEKAGHGGTIDEAYIDEAFAQVDTRLEQAFRPAMITRKNKQLGWISTAGWQDASPYLEAKVAAARAHVESGATSRLAYFEWSAEEDADPTDRDVWRACMPALGHTIDEDAIQGELDAMGLGEFRRAYLNLWVPKPLPKASAVFEDGVWESNTDEGSQIAHGIALALDVTPERSASSVSVAGLRADGLSHGEVIKNEQGTEWVIACLTSLRAKWGLRRVTLDPAGPAGALIAKIEAGGFIVDPVTAREYGQACGGLYDAVVGHAFRHLGQVELDQAVRAARKRALGDAWAWHRKDGTDISPLVAVTLALWRSTNPTGGRFLSF